MLLRSIFAVGLLLILVLPAQAVLTLGVASDSGNSLRAETEARQLANRLQGILGEEVRLRVLRSEPELNEWLQRYRMVDLALVSHRFYQTQPPGSLLPLTQPAPGRRELTVARPGLKAETLARLRSALVVLEQTASQAPATGPEKTAVKPARQRSQGLARPGDGELQPGQEILAAPGAAPRITAQPARKAHRTKPVAAKPAVTKPAVTKPTQAVATTEAASEVPPMAQSAPAVTGIKQPAESSGKPTPATAPSAPEPATALVLPPSQAAPEAAPGPASTAPAPATTAPQVPEPQAAPIGTTQPEEQNTSPLFWLGLLALLGGGVFLLLRRRRKPRSIDWSALQQKAPQPAPVSAARKPTPPPTTTPRSSQEAPMPRPLPMSRVPLPPTRKAAEPSTDPPGAVARISEGIPLAVMEPAVAAAAPPEAPRGARYDHQLGDLSSDLDSSLPELDLDLPSLEEFQALPLETAKPAPAVPSADTGTTDPEVALPAELPALPPRKPAKAPGERPPLRGDIATVDIPRLLEAAAAQPGPCILHIRGRHDEKRLHFRMGHMAEAVSVNRANRAKTGFLMNKVGYLLIRQGRINEEQRDQALRLCEERPKLRIGEALVELGMLSRESLLEALRTQAEGVIFSLFIFPEGRYEIVADDAEVSGANDLEIDIGQLLSKAESQEVEWQRIRQAIPSLDAVLDFPEGGRDKLDSARMTEHQKLVLSLINGHRPIRDICIAATMLDLEVYKFLFFMVNAKILTRVAAA